jgi:hypothetical protein
MSYQPGEPPGYTPPQDPWSSGPGVASPPTDPIPAPARGQYSPGVASPVAPSAGVWSQETVVQGYGGGGSGRGGRTGLYVLVVLIVIVLGGAGGVGAWYLIKDELQRQTVDALPTGPTDTPPTDQAVDPADARVGDCLFNRTPDASPTMVRVDCTTTGAMEILKIQSGEGILHNAEGRFDTDTANSICLGTARWDGSWLGWNSDNNALDYFFCLDNLSS